jgi:hypothetical protein
MILMSIANELGALMNTINILREEMIQTGFKEGLTSENTILLSQKLDNYIAQYQSMLLKA